MNERVWKLIRGFVPAAWKGIALTWLVLAAGAGWLLSDFMRAAAVLAVVSGFFFIEREVATLPVAARDVWRAEWLIATVGLTFLSASARAATGLLPWALNGAGDFLWFTIVDFMSAGVCAACAAFLLRTPDFVAKQSSIVRWLAGLAWLSMPAWCYYLRLYGPTDGRSITPVVAGLTLALAVVTYFGFRSQPVALRARIPLGLGAKRTSEGEDDSKSRSKGGDWRRADRPGDGVARWVWREMAWAVAYGVGGVLLMVPMEIWMPLGEREPTVLEAMSGIFRPGQPLGVALYAVFALAWLTRFWPNLRLLRSVPISLWTLVSIITAGPVVAWTSVWCLQMGVYRWSSGAWPSSPSLSVFFFTLSLLGAAKTVLLTIGNWFVILGIAFLVNLALLGLPNSWTTGGMAIVPAAACSISLVLLLMFADHMILARTSRLYRASTAIV